MKIRLQEILSSFAKGGRTHSHTFFKESTEIGCFRETQLKSDFFTREISEMKETLRRNNDSGLNVLLGGFVGLALNNTVEVIRTDVQGLGIVAAGVPLLVFLVDELLELEKDGLCVIIFWSDGFIQGTNVVATNEEQLQQRTNGFSLKTEITFRKSEHFFAVELELMEFFFAQSEWWGLTKIMEKIELIDELNRNVVLHKEISGEKNHISFGL